MHTYLWNVLAILLICFGWSTTFSHSLQIENNLIFKLFLCVFKKSLKDIIIFGVEIFCIGAHRKRDTKEYCQIFVFKSRE